MVSQLIEIRGMEELKRDLRTLRKLAPLRTEVLEPGAKLGQSVAKATAPSGGLRYNPQRDIRRRVTAKTARVYVSNHRARFIEKGRAAGAKLPPVRDDGFRYWAETHGIPQTRLFVLARAIAKRGIKGRFFMRAGREAVAAALPRLNANCARALERLWGTGK